jgi:hypothetical protein
MLAGDIAAFPDNEIFLALLWARIKAGAAVRPGEVWNIDSAEHLAMLRMAGVEREASCG